MLVKNKEFACELSREAQVLGNTYISAPLRSLRSFLLYRNCRAISYIIKQTHRTSITASEVWCVMLSNYVFFILFSSAQYLSSVYYFLGFFSRIFYLFIQIYNKWYVIFLLFLTISYTLIIDKIHPHNRIKEVQRSFL